MSVSAFSFDDIKKYMLFRFLSRFYFYFPILVIFFKQYNDNLLDVGILVATYSFAVAISGFIIGVLSDGCGRNRKQFLVFGELFKAAGLLVLTVGTGFDIWVIGQIFCGLGFSLVATNDSACLFELCLANGRKNDYKELEARSHSILFFALLMAGVIGAWVAQENMRLPFLLTIPFNGMAAVVASRIKLAAIPSQQERLTSKQALMQMAAEDSKLYYFAVLYALVRAIIMAAFIGLVPIYLFDSIRIDVKVFGVLFAFYMLVGYYSGVYQKVLEAKIGSLQYGVLLIIALIGSFVLSGYCHGYGWLVVPMGLYFVAGGIRPFAVTNMNLLLKNDSIRSTVLSVGELLFGISNAIITLGCFYITVHYSLTAAFQSLLFLIIALCVLGMLAAVLVYPRNNLKKVRDREGIS